MTNIFFSANGNYTLNTFLVFKDISPFVWQLIFILCTQIPIISQDKKFSTVTPHFTYVNDQ
jgi:hypothetical protein